MSLEFVDTNVLLYAYDVTAGSRHEQARELVTRLAASREGAISVQVLQEFFVNVVRKAAVKLTPEAARERVRVLGLWATHSPDQEDVLAAIDISITSQLSFWDAMIIRSAAALGCLTLWSEDLNDGQVINGVRVLNPFHD